MKILQRRRSGQKGQQAEQACCRYLRTQGLKLVERNYRCRYGEIDLVMRDADTLVFVEVRYRASERFGGALMSIDQRKQRKLMITARHYLHCKHIDSPARIDVVAMSSGDDGFRFDWLQDAIRAD